MHSTLLKKKLPCFPETLSCLVLPGMVVLPRGFLPLTLVEKHEMRLIETALKQDRFVGIIQAVDSENGQEDYFKSGCLGRIVTFHETENIGYFVVLKGVTRFLVEEELEAEGDLRTFKVSYDKYLADLVEESELREEREKLFPLLEGYFSKHNLSPNWEEMKGTPDDKLLTSLALMCPFEPGEKQALLETPTIRDRYRMIMAMIEMSFNKEAGNVQH